VINCVISLGLIYLAFRKVPTMPQKIVPNQAAAAADDSVPVFPPSRLLLFPALIFGCANIFLFIVPLIRPPPESEPYEHLPYWVHAVGGGAFSSLVGFGGCGIIVEGCSMNLDSGFGVRHGVCDGLLD